MFEVWKVKVKGGWGRRAGEVADRHQFHKFKVSTGMLRF